MSDDESLLRRRKRAAEEFLATLQDDPNFVPPPPRKVVLKSKNRIVSFLSSLVSTDPAPKNTISDKDFVFPHAIRTMLDEIYFDVMKEETVLTSSVHPRHRGVVFKYAVSIIHPCAASTLLLDKAWAVMGVADIDIQSGGDNSIVVTHVITLDDNTKKELIADRGEKLEAHKMARAQELIEARKDEVEQLAPTERGDIVFKYVRDNVDVVGALPLKHNQISGRSVIVCWPLKTGGSVCYKQLAVIRDHPWIESVVIGSKPPVGACLFLTFRKPK